MHELCQSLCYKDSIWPIWTFSWERKSWDAFSCTWNFEGSNFLLFGGRRGALYKPHSCWNVNLANLQNIFHSCFSRHCTVRNFPSLRHRHETSKHRVDSATRVCSQFFICTIHKPSRVVEAVSSAVSFLMPCVVCGTAGTGTPESAEQILTLSFVHNLLDWD